MKKQHPEWSKNGNIYEVNLRQYTAEGTFTAFAKHLPRLKDMGVKIFWFMPITPISKEDRLGTLGSYYAVQNYIETNPEFGSMDDFKNLVKEAHEMNFKVIVDFVANHTGNDHHWVKEHPEFYIIDESQNILHPHGWDDVSQLNYENPELRIKMIEALQFWVKKCDIDGYRCDMAHLVPLDFWEEATHALSKVKEDLFWLAECEVPEYHNAFDATYTWRWMHASQEFYQQKMNLQSLLTVLYKTNTEFPETALRTYFTSNHDENSWNGTEYEKYGDAALMFAVFSCTWKGIPMIYSGQELPNKKRLKFFEKDVIEWSDRVELHNFYKTLLSLKSANPALDAANEDGLIKIISHPEEPEFFSFLRKNNDDEVLVILNCCSTPKEFGVKAVNGDFRNVFGGPDVNFTFDTITSVFLKAWGYLVFEKVKILSDSTIFVD